MEVSCDWLDGQLLQAKKGMFINMKKIITWISIATLIIFVIDWGIVGLKLFAHNYDIIPEAYIGCACWLILLFCNISKLFTERCPHCKKIQIVRGRYCPYCGRELK